MKLATLLLRIPDDWMSSPSDSSDIKIEMMICAPKNGHRELCLMMVEEFGDMSEGTIANHTRPAGQGGKAGSPENGLRRFLATIRMHSCRMCAILRDSNCQLEPAISRLDGNVRWNIIAPNDAALNRLVANMKDAGTDVVIEKITVLRTMRELTTEQERILQSAFDFGYFDTPKKIKLDALARRLDIPRANLGVVLRRARRKVVASHVGSFR